MKYKTSLAALLLSASLIGVPALSSAAYAHDGWDKSGSSSCGHEHLSKDKMELLRSTVKQVHEDNKAVFEELHKLDQERHDILAAKYFDKDAFLSVSAKIEQTRDQLRNAHVQAFASIADKFTPEERERLGKMWGHHHHHHDGDWQHHDGQKDDMKGGD